MASLTLLRRASSSSYLVKVRVCSSAVKGKGNSQVDEFGVVHLEKHTGDLASEVGLEGLDLGEEVLAKNLLLLLDVAVGRRQLSLQQAASAQLAAGSAATSASEATASIGSAP